MAKQPNILLVISDDHAAPALSCYGSTLIQTPNLDQIAREGVRFDRALVVNSLCTPSPATYLTGTYSHVNQVTTLDTPIDVPDTFEDDLKGRATPAHHATMRVADDLADVYLKLDPPEDLNYQELGQWKYQRYMQDYLRCILAIDENVGRLREHITERGDHEQTLTIYGADHGFFLGEHGWFDKRFMYEPSMRIPLVMAYPRKVPAG